MTPPPDDLFRPVDEGSAHTGIVAQVERAIDSGALKPGDRLPGERALMAEFGVSRPTVREAVRVLKVGGVIRSDPGDPRGPLVLGYSSEPLQRALDRLSRHGGASRVELLQFRFMLETTAARLAAGTGEGLAGIEAARDHLARVAPEDYPQASDDFLAAVRRASDNPLLELCGEVFAQTMRQLAAERLGREADPGERIHRGAEGAIAITAAIASGDGLAAAEAMTTGLWRYYADDLDPEETARLRQLV